METFNLLARNFVDGKGCWQKYRNTYFSIGLIKKPIITEELVCLWRSYVLMLVLVRNHFSKAFHCRRLIPIIDEHNDPWKSFNRWKLSPSYISSFNSTISYARKTFSLCFEFSSWSVEEIFPNKISKKIEIFLLFSK